MAEVVSLVASIVAVAELAQGVVRLCKGYIDAVKDAPRDLRVILVEMSTLKGLLDSVSLLQDDPLLVKQYDLLMAQTEHLRETLAEIERLLGENEVEKPGSKRRKITRSLSTLAWPIKKPRIMQRLEDIGKCKSTISLILLADTSKELKEIRHDMLEIKDKLSDDERHKILKKLVIVDPSSNHSQACHLHEPHTSSWITRSEEWRAWIVGDLRFFWIHGIPGAGKTILASHMIEEVKSICEQATLKAPCGWSYYYCHHSRTADILERTSFLGWIVSQLSKQAHYVPETVDNAIHLGRMATNSELNSALVALARRFEKIYIIIDALDETQHRLSFLALLQALECSPDLENLRIIATSRDELDIRRALTPISTALSMSNQLVERDIQNYVHVQLRSDPKFTRWPQGLLHDVEYALATGARGMFRWAACQLQILRRLNTASAVRKALADLPETLDETYERILCSIPTESKHLAFRILSILCVQTSEALLQAPILAEAIRWTDLSQNQPEDELLDTDALFELCVCLLTTTDEGIIVLAHYTVKEFVLSKRILTGPAKDFGTSPDDADRLYLTTLLNRLLWLEGPENLSSLHLLKVCMKLLTENLLIYDRILSKSADLQLKVCTLLHPSTPHLLRIARWLDGSDDTREFFESERSRTPSRLFDRISNKVGGSAELVARIFLLRAEEVAVTYINSLDRSHIKSMFEATVPLYSYGKCTLLEIAAIIGSSRLVNLLLQKGMRPAPENKIMYFLARKRFHDPSSEIALAEENFKLALDAGANANPSNVPATPLQNVVFQAQPKMVAWLLEAGANPNDIGEEVQYIPINYVDEYANLRLSPVYTIKKPFDICVDLLRACTAGELHGETFAGPGATTTLRDIGKLLASYGGTRTPLPSGRKMSSIMELNKV